MAAEQPRCDRNFDNTFSLQLFKSLPEVIEKMKKLGFKFHSEPSHSKLLEVPSMILKIGFPSDPNVKETILIYLDKNGQVKAFDWGVFI